jgi:hypothetical protein
MKNIQFCCLFLWLLGSGLVQAQESVNASGGDAIGSGGSVAYSIGQVAYTTQAGSNGSVAQGVQHAYEIFKVGINETDLNLSILIFPNPTVDQLIIDMGEFNDEPLAYQFYDMRGRLLSSGQLISPQTLISTTDLASGAYLVHIINQSNRKVQTFKIIKN